VERARLANVSYKTRSRAAEGQKVNKMAPTRDFKRTVVERVKRDSAFARALLDEAATLFLNGEADTARLVLHDLVSGTVGFDKLAVVTGKPAKSLHRMLSKNGNPSMDNLAAIINVLCKKLGVELDAHTVEAA
jgi:DNA-binding phage protein